LGVKNKKGFYIYDEDNEIIDVNKDIDKIYQKFLMKRREAHSNFNEILENKNNSKYLVDRVIFLLINEATNVLFEKIVKFPEDIDLILIFTLGFPKFRGGLLSYTDELIHNKSLNSKFRKLVENFGKRYKPTVLIKQMNYSNQLFFQNRIFLNSIISKVKPKL
jgi:3-hydroxyacyl-CoA dehydrogenase / enoyl-CoA hydratase / 3-hydroxybutyryl-CoA epimerase